MRVPKVYQLANLSDAVLSTLIADTLGLPVHVRQGRYVVVAPTKVEGIAHLDAVGLAGFRGKVNLAVAIGNDVETLTAEGLLSEPGTVLAWGSSVFGQAVARVSATGTPSAPTVEVIGHWQRDPERYGRARFVPVT